MEKPFLTLRLPEAPWPLRVLEGLRPRLGLRRLLDVQAWRWGRVLRRRLRADDLGEEARARFWGLADAFAGRNPKKTAIGILRTNAHYVEDGDLASEAGESPGQSVGVFATAVRFNHDCAPNVHYAWPGEGEAMTMHALREVGEGEELCVSYVDLYQTRAARQAELLERYAFRCACAACRLRGAALARSEAARGRLKKLGEGEDAATAAAPGGGGGGPRAEAMLGLLDEELRGHPALKRDACHDAFLEAFVEDRGGEARDWAALAYEHSVTAEGEDAQLSRALKAAADGDAERYFELTDALE